MQASTKRLESNRQYEKRRQRWKEPQRKEYNRFYQIKKLYGIGQEEYEKLLAEQRGACAICGSFPGPGHSLSVDHDHVTGQVRGLLCKYCNSWLGLVKDQPEKAVEYLKKRRD